MGEIVQCCKCGVLVSGPIAEQATRFDFDLRDFVCRNVQRCRERAELASWLDSLTRRRRAA